MLELRKIRPIKGKQGPTRFAGTCDADCGEGTVSSKKQVRYEAFLLGHPVAGLCSECAAEWKETYADYGGTVMVDDGF